MAEDRKFRFDYGLGKFVNRVSGEAIPHDEPVILFRARDVHALDTLSFYLTLAEDDFHRQVVQERINEFATFRAMHPDRMKEPGITHHYDLHSSRRHPFLEPGNADLQESRRHERSQDQRLSELEHRDDILDKEMKKAMADINTLNSILQGISDDASSLGDDFKNLEAELQAAQAAAANNQPIDLTNAILVARNAQSALDAIVASAATVAPPAPAPATGDQSGAATGDQSGAATGDQSGAATGDQSGAATGDQSGAATGDGSGAATGDQSDAGQPTE